MPVEGFHSVTILTVVSFKGISGSGDLRPP